ncbi:MAG: hypothetical protein EOP50_14365 [Sphingobacteriales bacterium]|nr:MAG: hypothetical protein EOP50_14365 [Sphingobacteriales bacterium]
MANATRDNTKPKKRPPETGTLVGVRLQADTLAQLDAYRAEFNPEPTRPEAIRRILETNLGSKAVP